MRIMALDVGDRSIGVAVSDPLMVAARGIDTIERVGIRKDAGKVIALIDEYECGTVVVGLPVRLDGSNSPQTDKAIEFKTMLENKLRSSGRQGVSVTLHDERFTSVIAERVLIEADVSRKKRKAVIDMQAAVVILQSYLDTLAQQRET
ncbi:MAG: Holliday junction resolvase RuvX [Clostridiales Family XIII bacterium]|jgi:putative Holliday junction resolvase|nr:Holliday junction resolvase RuvX [Clostridiales Family XIII bacterium]